MLAESEGRSVRPASPAQTQTDADEAKTKTGLTVSAKLNSKIYEKGQAVTEEEMKLLNIRAHRTLPEWNYTIRPYDRKRSSLQMLRRTR